MPKPKPNEILNLSLPCPAQFVILTKSQIVKGCDCFFVPSVVDPFILANCIEMYRTGKKKRKEKKGGNGDLLFDLSSFNDVRTSVGTQVATTSDGIGH